MHVLILIFTFVVCSFGATPCVFSSFQGNTFAISDVNTVHQCFESVPLNLLWKNETLTQMSKLVDLYSFTDISVNSGSPYNIQVDLRGGLATIKATQQPSDWDFHYQLSVLFSGLGDAHTLYTPPTPYENFVLLRPFVLASSLNVNLTQIITVSSITTLFGQIPFDQLVTVKANLTSLIGQQLIAINGIPVIQWLSQKGKAMGTVKDPSVQFNNALGSSSVSLVQELNWTTLATSDNYTFAGGVQVNVPNAFLSLQTYTGLASFMTQLTPAATKKRQVEYNPNPWLRSPGDPIREKQNFEQLLLGDPRSTSDYSFEELSNLQYGGLRELAKSKPSYHDLYDYARSKKKQAGAITVNLIQASNSSSAICYQLIDSRGLQSLGLALTTFAPPSTFVTNADINNWIQSYITTIQTCVNTAAAQNILYLTVDVRSNGGGIICLALASIVSLFGDYNPTVTGKVFSPFDMRKTASMTILEAFTDTPLDYLYEPISNPPTVFASTDTSFYTNTTQYNRGGILGNYTVKAGFPASCLPLVGPNSYFVVPPTFQFNKVILLTDGLCGSACSQFLSRLRSDQRVTVVSVGGLYGSPMESSSFTGGNVEDWTSIVPLFNFNANGTTSENYFQLLPTTAFTRFNHREMYLQDNDTVPREFIRLLPDVQLSLWVPQTQAQALAIYDASSLQFGVPPATSFTPPFVPPFTPPFVPPFTPPNNSGLSLFPTLTLIISFVYYFLM